MHTNNNTDEPVSWAINNFECNFLDQVQFLRMAHEILWYFLALQKLMSFQWQALIALKQYYIVIIMEQPFPLRSNNT